MSIALIDIAHRYGSRSTLADIRLDVSAGELVAVIGPSGSGKSTLLSVVAGFLQPSGGRVLLGGVDCTALPARAREVGVVFQHYALFPHMSAAGNVAYPLKLRRIDRSERDDRVRQALSMVGLLDHANRLPAQLSGGQQQRVALARALVYRPRALLLDEPLSALDAARRHEMRDEIRRLQRQHGIATLHVTHDQEEALSMADRVVVLADGRIQQQGTPENLYQRPANRFVAAFVGQANLWEGRVLGPTEVETALGRLRCAPCARAAGSPVTVLIRPEHVGAGAGPAGANVLQGRVVRDRFLGSVRRLDVEVPGGTLLVEGQAADSGAFHVSPEHVCLLDSEPASQVASLVSAATGTRAAVPAGPQPASST
jgi:putative spermidine/putrescine transport system ATP-binding protein